MEIDSSRLLSRIAELGSIGGLSGGGCCRLALTDQDRAGRDYIVKCMRELKMTVHIDRVGNIIAIREGRRPGPPVMTGSHIDTVSTGGIYDGCLGVLAGLEVVETLNEADIATDHPIAVAVFSNEEGVRFMPDMFGSLVYSGQLEVEEALGAIGTDGTIYGEELRRIGYDGDFNSSEAIPRAYVELHIEQGPVLEREHLEIGVVESVQGISWTRWDLRGQSNHAGTTPMNLRHDAGYAAGAIAHYVRQLAVDMGLPQVGTVGSIRLDPNLINVIARSAQVTVDLRNTDDALLRSAEESVANFVTELAAAEGLHFESTVLVSVAPVIFDDHVIRVIEDRAGARNLSHRRMPSGAGHDAQMLAAVCPAGMIFVPSQGGISHNVNEFTSDSHIAAGANVLLDTLLELATD